MPYETLTNQAEKNFDPNLTYREKISFDQITSNEQYRETIQNYITVQTPKFSTLNLEQKLTYLSGLKNLGNYHIHSSFYPDTITQLWKSKQLENLQPTLKIERTKLKNLIEFSLVRTQFSQNENDSIPETRVEELEKEYPSLCLRGEMLQFGPHILRNDGSKDCLGITELGWFHMPEYYSRLNIYSDLIKNQNADKEKLNTFTETLSHLYADSLERKAPLFGKFTTTDSEVRLCSYTNDDLLAWQLESLSKYFGEPITVNTILRDGENAEIKLFSNGQIGVRSSNEAGADKMLETGRLLRLINKLRSEQ